MIRKIVKYALRTAAILSGMVVLCVIALYLPPVQRLIKNKAVAYVSENFGMQLAVERLRLRFPLRLAIDDAQAVTTGGDTLFRCASLRADIALWPLLRKEVVVRQFEFGETSFHLNDTTGGLDLKVRVRELALTADRVDLAQQTAHIPSLRLSGATVGLTLSEAQPDTAAIDTATAPLRWKIAADRLLLDKIAFAMRNTSPESDLTARIESGEIDSCAVDLGDQSVDVGRLSLDGGGFAYLSDTTASSLPGDQTEPADTSVPAPWTIVADAIRIGDFSVRYGLPWGTPRPGFDPNHIGISGLSITIDSAFNRGTEVRATLADLRFTERSGLVVTRTRGDIRMDSTGYSLQSFLLQTAASTLRAQALVGGGIASMEPATPIDIDLSLTLGASDLSRFIEWNDTLRRQLGNRTLTVGAQVGGILNKLNLSRFSVELPRVFALRASGSVQQPTDPERMQGRVALNGELTDPRFFSPLLPDGMTLPRMRLRSDLRAAAGRFKGLATLWAGDGKLTAEGSLIPRSEQYTARIEADSLPLYAVLPTDSSSIATFAIRADGRGFDPFSSRTAARVEAQVTHAVYDRLDFGGLSLTAALADHRFRGQFTGENRALNADLHFGGLLTRARQEASIEGRIAQLDLERMHLVTQPANASLRLRAAASATETKAYTATVELDTVRVRYGTFENTVSRTTLTAEADSAHARADVSSGDLQLTFRSLTGLDSLAGGFDRAIPEIRRQIRASRIDADTLGHTLPPFSLDFRAGRNNILNHYLLARGMGFGQATLTARTTHGKPFDIRAEVNRFSTEGIVLDTIQAGIGSRNGRLRYFARLGNRPGNMNRLGSIFLDGNASGNSALVRLVQLDRKGRKGLDFGLRGTLTDSAVTVNLVPRRPVFGFSEWSVNGGNYVRYAFDRSLTADLRIQRPGQSFSLQSSTASDMPAGSLRLGVTGFDIAGALNLLPKAPPVGGRLGVDLTFGLADSLLAAQGTIAIDTLRYENRPVGDVGLQLAYRSETRNGQQGSASLSIDRQPALSLSGHYHPADTARAVRLTADLPGIPLAVLNPFLPEGSGSLTGTLAGHIEADGPTDALRLDGSLRFVKTSVDVAAIGTRFGISENPILLQGGQVMFKEWGLIAPNRQPLAVNGSIDLHDFRQIAADLRIDASDFQLVNVEKNMSAMVFGRASADLSARVRGPLEALNIRGSATLLTGTEVTYVMRESPMSVRDQSQNVVNFTSFNDTTTVYGVRPPAIIRPTGIDMLMNVSIDPDVEISVYLSEDGRNRIDLHGGGNLTYSMNRLGDTRFAGKYELSGGRVRYSPPVISTKDFAISPGGYVSWTGDIADPSFSIRAAQTLRTTVTMEDQTSRQVTFQIIIAISGSMQQLDVQFDLAAPEDLTLQNQLASLTPEQRQNQAMSLLIYNTYTSPGTSAKVNTGNPLNSFIAKELNQWAQNSLPGVDLSFGVDSYDDPAAGPGGTRTDYSYKLSKKFFDNRVRVSVGGKVTTGDPNQSAAENLIDDISLEYQLTRRDNMYLKVFRETDFESILEGDVTETGVGFGVRKKILKLGDLFRLTKEKKEVKEARKAARQERREERRQQRQTEKNAAIRPAEPQPAPNEQPR